jgi:hypothetical protein
MVESQRRNGETILAMGMAGSLAQRWVGVNDRYIAAVGLVPCRSRKVCCIIICGGGRARDRLESFWSICGPSSRTGISDFRSAEQHLLWRIAGFGGPRT